jgi:serine protease Do
MLAHLRFFSFLLAATVPGIFCNAPGVAQQRPELFAEANAVFKRLTAEERIHAQLLLTASGYWNAVPNLDFSNRMFESIKWLQSEMGVVQNGQLGQAELGQVERNAIPILRKWGLRSVKHPERPARIWIPFGLNLALTRDSYGLNYKDSQDRISISFNHFPNLELASTYAMVLQSKREKGHKIHFSVIRPDFYVISSSTPNGVDAYERYHRDGLGIVGFHQNWLNAATDIKAASLATLISASLWGQYTRFPLPNPERLQSYRFQAAAIASAPKETDVPVPASAPAAPKTPAPETSGTGFVATSSGTIITNAHVVDRCKTVELSTRDQPKVSARIVAKDDKNDIAILSSSDLKVSDVSEVRQGTKLGEQVVAFGFPLTGILSESGNFTLGNVTSLAGLGNDSRYLQVSTPVQPGNSGGPLIDQHGNVVGIVTSKLNALKMAIAHGDIPQNVNFALKVGIAANLLETQGVTLKQGTTETILSPVDLAEKARRLSVQVNCLQ